MNKLFCSKELSRFVLLVAFIFSSSISAYSATFTVTKTSDTNDGICNADCSLREAIAAANSSADADTITFSSLFNSPQTITLTINRLDIINNGSLTINGAGANLLTISGNNSNRVFVIQGATASFNNLKISDGKTPGNGSGGGILNYLGSVTINNSIITNNSTDLAFSYSNGGGGVHNNGIMVIENSVISNNTASGSGGGISSEDGAVSGLEVRLTINNSVVSGNTTAQSAGGILSGALGTLNIANTTISNNTAKNFGGGLLVSKVENMTNVTITNNTAQEGGGGGIFNSSPYPLTINNSVISNNMANTDAGGVLNRDDGNMTITNSVINNNKTIQGQGGGITNHRGTLNINNSIIRDNSASGSGGGVRTESLNSKLNVTN